MFWPFKDFLVRPNSTQTVTLKGLTFSILVPYNDKHFVNMTLLIRASFFVLLFVWNKNAFKNLIK